MKNLLTLFVLGGLSLAGCGPSGPPMGSVSGTVKIDDAAPKEPVRVNFVNNSIGQGTGSALSADGSFKLETELPPAEYTVFLTRIPPASASPSSTSSEVLTSVAREYRTEEKSPLKLTVKEGSNTFEITVPAATAGKK